LENPEGHGGHISGLQGMGGLEMELDSMLVPWIGHSWLKGVAIVG
jgi:hypothetical protein